MAKLFSKSGVEVEELKVKEKEFLGIKIELKGAPLLIIKGKRLIVGCAYLNLETLEKMGNAACMVSGVRSFEDVLKSEIKALSEKALELGIKLGMKAEDALELD